MPGVDDLWQEEEPDMPPLCSGVFKSLCHPLPSVDPASATLSQEHPTAAGGLFWEVLCDSAGTRADLPFCSAGDWGWLREPVSAACPAVGRRSLWVLQSPSSVPCSNRHLVFAGACQGLWSRLGSQP